MNQNKIVTTEELECDCKPNRFDFTTTDEIEPFTKADLIGQNRAVKAMDLGLQVEQDGYNIFISGATGTGRTTYSKTLVEQKSKEYQAPHDICYVYNFTNSEKPKALSIPAGTGVRLQADMNDLIKELKEEIPQAFKGEEYQKQKNKITSNYQQKSNQIMQEFEQKIKERGFILQNTSQGLVPVPLDEEGEPISEDNYQQLDKERKNKIRRESQQIQNELEQIMSQIQEVKSKAQEEIKNLEQKIASSVIQPIIAKLEDKYDDCSEIVQYLKEVQQDLVENLDKFKKMQEKSSSSPLPEILNPKSKSKSFFNRYKINLLVDNQDQDHAPVIYESNPNYYNLFGKIEGKSQFGTVTTDFTMIKKGAIHKANGGYLILKAKDVLKKPFAWETLKRILINQEIVIENIGEQYRTMPITTLKPEPIPLDIKVIMVGNPLIYQLLYNYDEEFKKLFKVKADFDVEMKRNQENMEKFASFIASISNREDIKHFSAAAVSEVIKFSSRLAGDREKMTTRFNEILELLFEANAWSEGDYIQRDDVLKAISEKEYRSNLTEEKIQEMISKNHILVDVKDQVVGQINGLAVYQTGQYSFGRPTRITARTFVGQEGIVNIEREAKMSGKVHNKAVMILSGYLGGKYAQDTPLSLSASLAFEQSYGGIDGDSASCAELIALLSSIAQIPINQNLAITGSMNQKGEVQPIGGVNQKIEGFYKVCELKGFTGEQGVIVPVQNKDNLMLKPEVIKAVKADKFNIYAVENINEAIEIMMDTSAEKVHQQVKEKLVEFANKATESNKE